MRTRSRVEGGRGSDRAGVAATAVRVPCGVAVVVFGRLRLDMMTMMEDESTKETVRVRRVASEKNNPIQICGNASL
jgi:hypothetical protein